MTYTHNIQIEVLFTFDRSLYENCLIGAMAGGDED